MEQDRLDMFHEVWLQLLDRQLGLAPVKSPLNVLDIATGTGIWAFQFADDHPDSRVIGTDLSMIQPSAVRMLPNCTFVREDSEEHWIFDHKFDYIHMRAVCSCFNDPLTVIQHSFDNLNAGGWVEIQDVCMELHGVDKTIEDTELQRFCRLGRQGFQLLGRDVVDRVFRYKKWLIDAGFVDVIEKRLPVPVNPWPRDARLKNLGRYNHAQLYEGMKSGAVKTLPAAGLSPQLAEELLNRALKDLSNTSIHGYLPFYVVYGRKPYTDEAGSNSGHGTTPSVS
ncbi:S-adenosyl-L-methionine-dependent methyltransferase [Pseudomassariella vexata]|uniref:S-adenosyl-L-methionine-dependent methyltransferase n=1 Tax=Pseudomassariella vexata TaxID=1141098 RepID=A0A1Y2DX72_9PEZI|nr:S-adenosyl-L-methionine-dependent methyltransferase [Pseudomassariella vexata]ORY63892.1 S-adenosyl-L-methionine-dependent methyltransferase [Pseudomassariella vexata]